jgi:hypothetical protein
MITRSVISWNSLARQRHALVPGAKPAHLLGAMMPEPSSLRVRGPMATPAWLPWACGCRDVLAAVSGLP